MSRSLLKTGSKIIIELKDFQKLFDSLKNDSYQLLGPTVSENAVIYDKIESIEDLPAGWIDEQEGGYYRLRKGSDGLLFGYISAPQSWKKYLYPPKQCLWRAKRNNGEFKLTQEKIEPEKQAFIGVRPCELKAIEILDKVFMNGEFADTGYGFRRRNNFIVAVNCGRAGGTCFCVSMKTGPKAESGFDMALTEIIDGENHYFLTEIGSKKGAKVAGEIIWRDADEAAINKADDVIKKTAENMGRNVQTDGLPELLKRNIDNPIWEKVAERCLSCTNCTMVCPTCFCTTIEDTTDLTGEHTERWRKWDSCFNLEFSYIHGGSIRQSISSRYRQWMTHKLSSWVDQFGTSGCVGCGRCITWCPVGIDLTAEARAIREKDMSKSAADAGREKKDAIA